MANNSWYNDLFGSGVNVFGAGGNGNTQQMIDLGLLAPDAKSKAQSQSLMRGLLGTAVSYAAQPQNQNYGQGATPYIAKALQQGMTMAQQPFDQLGQTASQNMQLQKYKDAKETKENYKEFGKGLGLKANNDTRTVQYKTKLNPNLTDENGNQIGSSMLDSNFRNEVQTKEQAYFNKQKYLDDALAKGIITPEQYAAHKPDSPEYMAVGDRVFNKSTGKFTEDGIGLNLTAGEKKIDENYATQYFEYMKGAADTEKQIDQLGLALNTLQTTKDGSITGRRVAALDSAGKLAYVDPEAQKVYDQVTEVVQRNLRLVLGAQFTEKEGERLIARAYNPALGQEENARRVKALMTQIKTAHEAQKQMAQHFRVNGTLKGYEMNQEALADSLYNMFPENDVVIQEPEGSNNDQLNAILNKYE
jgi:hypothetical protein